MSGIEEIIDYGVLGLLGLMSFVAAFIIIERYLFFFSIKLGEYRKKQQLELDLTRYLPLVATIGSNAPFIGLLGTVLSIMLTFYTISSGGMMESKEIMLSLSLALKATAAGLLVAIPATAFYNLLVRKSERLVAQWEMEYE